MPNTTLPFTIETNALKYASGAVLLQLDTNGDIHPCDISPSHSTKQSEIMKYMTENSSQ